MLNVQEIGIEFVMVHLVAELHKHYMWDCYADLGILMKRLDILFGASCVSYCLLERSGNFLLD